MKISKKENLETIRISHFNRNEDASLEIFDMEFGVALGSSTYAVAAMIKGFHEFYLVPGGESVPEDMLEHVRQNLEFYNAALVKARSGLII